ncbi:hypothetical protein MLIT_47640 [Mycolicibacterium litorale]|uniref:Uncharacterized protein n=1 Tax=Mycolicibacterium litorale TaxID=758802 RepID=A0AAD1INJ6_9MYCO|nr:hypothetical protein MLIT_47640 [Mycolicibacterium litorale]
MDQRHRGRRRNPVDVVAQRGFAQQDEHSGGGGHGTTVACGSTPQRRPAPELLPNVDEPATVDNFGAALGDLGSATFRHHRSYPDCENNPPKKGRPPPGGEEAEVVVYQPRGVGLMHTRHNPGNAHYTHGTATECKSRAP